jgi:hypothetical protein
MKMYKKALSCAVLVSIGSVLMLATVFSAHVSIGLPTAEAQQAPMQEIGDMYAWDTNKQEHVIPLKAISDPITQTAASIEGFQINQDNVVQLRQNDDFVVKGNPPNDENILAVTLSDLNGLGIVQLQQKSPDSKNYWSIAGIAPEKYIANVKTRLPNGQEAIYETLLVILSSKEEPETQPNVTVIRKYVTSKQVITRITNMVIGKNPSAPVTTTAKPPGPAQQPSAITPPPPPPAVAPTTSGPLPAACKPGQSPPTSNCTPGKPPNANGACNPGEAIAPGTSLCFPRETIPPAPNPSGVGGQNQPPRRPVDPALGPFTPDVCERPLVLTVGLNGFICTPRGGGPFTIGVPGGLSPAPCVSGRPSAPAFGPTCTPGIQPGPGGTCERPGQIKLADGLCYPNNIIIPELIPQRAAAGDAAAVTAPQCPAKPDAICPQGFRLVKGSATQADRCEPVSIPNVPPPTLTDDGDGSSSRDDGDRSSSRDKLPDIDVDELPDIDDGEPSIRDGEPSDGEPSDGEPSDGEPPAIGQ